MEADRKRPRPAQAAGAARDELAADLAHLQKLWASVQRTEIIVRRAISAYKDSRELLVGLDAKEAKFKAVPLAECGAENNDDPA